MSEFDTKQPDKEKPKLSADAVLKKLNEDWNFDKFIEPYREGGKPDMPVTRTWGTMIDWLVNKRKYPMEVVGAAIFLIWMRHKKDGPIKPDKDANGNVIYGSAGRKFSHAVAGMCAVLMQQKVTDTVFTNMAGTIEERIKAAFRNDMFALMPWFVKMFSVKYWKHRNQLRKIKKAQKKVE